jgi:hypothetical protein
MAILFTRADNDYIDCTPVGFGSTTSCTIFFTAYLDALAVNQQFFTPANAGATEFRFSVQAQSAGGGRLRVVTKEVTTGNMIWDRTGGPSDATWFRLAIAFDSADADNPDFVLDGSDDSSNWSISSGSGGSYSSGIGLLRLGNGSGASNQALNGRMQEIAIWNRILTIPEMQVLTDLNGPSALSNPQNLDFYAPLRNTSEYMDWAGGNSFATGGASDAADTPHTKVYYPAPVFYSFPATAGGVTRAPTKGTVSIAGQAVAAKQDQREAPTAGTLSIAGQAVTLTLNVREAPPTGIVAIAGQSAALALNIREAPALGIVAIAGVQTTVKQDINKVPSQGSIVLAGTQPTVSVGIKLGTGALTLAGVQTTLTLRGHLH